MKSIYLMKAGAKQYKVGIANDVFKRLKTLQTSNAKRIAIVTFQPTPDASAVERKIHALLAEYRDDGGREWFGLTASQVIKICTIIHSGSALAVSDVAALREAITLQNERQREVFDEFRSIMGQMDGLLERAEAGMKAHMQPTQKTRPEPKPKIDREELDRKLLEQATELVTAEHRASTSLLQRRLSIGYGRASRIIDQLEAGGYVGPHNGARPRQLLGL